MNPSPSAERSSLRNLVDQITAARRAAMKSSCSILQLYCLELSLILRVLPEYLSILLDRSLALIDPLEKQRRA